MRPLVKRPNIPGIAPEGYPLIAGGAAVTALTARYSRPWTVVPLAFTVATTLFFRDPKRPLPSDKCKLVAAADGLVTRVDTIDEPRFIKGRALRIVTFLSLFDVHINRMPVDGTVRYVEHLPGEFRAAWDAEADLVNERNYIGLETAYGPVLLIQIAGLVARRIVCHVGAGSSVRAGERMGMIKFGSRTDVIVPEGVAHSLVVPGRRVLAGVTPIGEWL
jgi:phosphatidylserine decarboxylase